MFSQGIKDIVLGAYIQQESTREKHLKASLSSISLHTAPLYNHIIAHFVISRKLLQAYACLLENLSKL